MKRVCRVSALCILCLLRGLSEIALRICCTELHKEATEVHNEGIRQIAGDLKQGRP